MNHLSDVSFQKLEKSLHLSGFAILIIIVYVIINASFLGVETFEESGNVGYVLSSLGLVHSMFLSIQVGNPLTHHMNRPRQSALI